MNIKAYAEEHDAPLAKPTIRALLPKGPWRVIGDGQHPTNKRITSDSRPHIAKVYATNLNPDPVTDRIAAAIALIPDMIEFLTDMEAYSFAASFGGDHANEGRELRSRLKALIAQVTT